MADDGGRPARLRRKPPLRTVNNVIDYNGALLITSGTANERNMQDLLYTSL